jgi:hypothetical protein
MFQTDQNRPFLFPFSKISMGRQRGSLVPFAIDEADKLYHKHMYVSLALWQMWRTREECMTAESGLDHMPGSEKITAPKVAPSVCKARMTQPHMAATKPFQCVYPFQDDDPSETLPDVSVLDGMIAEAEEMMAKAQGGAEMRRAKERKEDLLRLRRVEQIYVCVLL